MQCNTSLKYNPVLHPGITPLELVYKLVAPLQGYSPYMQEGTNIPSPAGLKDTGQPFRHHGIPGTTDSSG